jgi:hypothetical protein
VQGGEPAFVDVEVVLAGAVLQRPATHQAPIDPVPGELVEGEGGRYDLASPLGRRGPFASLNEAELVGEPALGSDLVTEGQTSGMAVSIGAHIECFPSPAGWRHSPENPVRRSRFGATPPTGRLLGISYHNTRAG